jgi:sugar/nucleoside kinase (ribokinase family)
MAAGSSLVVVGAATRDIDPADARGWRLGGTVTYSSLAAARLGMPVKALVGVDSESEKAYELDTLRAAGVEVRLVRLEHGPVFDNRNTPMGRRQHTIGASDRIPLDALPDDWRSPVAALIGPVAEELGDEWADAFEPSTFVGLAAQGLLRRLVPGRPVERVPLSASPFMERADAILVSAEDVVGEAPEVRHLLRERQKLIVTHGEHGALLVERSAGRLRGRFLPATPRRHAIDTTGAGDIFLAAFLVGNLLFGRQAAALILASATASLSVEQSGLDAVPRLADVCKTLAGLRERLTPGTNQA